eukprot:TRINITY_DN105352_c0_g1_i1.p1 TRINITY_DN105352_c0_g1~~TRINITY_DN105352_c0_g1_i1.p1  ORF type:complete len:160 (-),score=6.46 TRINITY_DN105352_c0_g1_i1:36-515(-)
MADDAYVQGAWGKGPEYPHPPARGDLLVEPKLFTFTKNLEWEANTRAASQATLDRWYASLPSQRKPFASLPRIATNPASPFAPCAEATLSPTATASPASPAHGQSWGMSRTSSAPQVNLANLTRVSRNVHSYSVAENALRARGWTSTHGTYSQIFRPTR